MHMWTNRCEVTYSLACKDNKNVLSNPIAFVCLFLHSHFLSIIISSSWLNINMSKNVFSSISQRFKFCRRLFSSLLTCTLFLAIHLQIFVWQQRTKICSTSGYIILIAKQDNNFDQIVAWESAMSDWWVINDDTKTRA